MGVESTERAWLAGAARGPASGAAVWMQRAPVLPQGGQPGAKGQHSGCLGSLARKGRGATRACLACPHARALPRCPRSALVLCLRSYRVRGEKSDVSLRFLTKAQVSHNFFPSKRPSSREIPSPAPAAREGAGWPQAPGSRSRQWPPSSPRGVPPRVPGSRQTSAPRSQEESHCGQAGQWPCTEPEGQTDRRTGAQTTAPRQFIGLWLTPQDCPQELSGCRWTGTQRTRARRTRPSVARRDRNKGTRRAEGTPRLSPALHRQLQKAGGWPAAPPPRGGLQWARRPPRERASSCQAAEAGQLPDAACKDRCSQRWEERTCGSLAGEGGGQRGRPGSGAS